MAGLRRRAPDPAGSGVSSPQPAIGVWVVFEPAVRQVWPGQPDIDEPVPPDTQSPGFATVPLVKLSMSNVSAWAAEPGAALSSAPWRREPATVPA